MQQMQEETNPGAISSSALLDDQDACLQWGTLASSAIDAHANSWLQDYDTRMRENVNNYARKTGRETLPVMSSVSRVIGPYKKISTKGERVRKQGRKEFPKLTEADTSSGSSRLALSLLAAMPRGVQLGASYTLTPAETETCIRIGLERNSKNIANNSKNMNYSSRDDSQIQMQGVAGEYAFCKLFGLAIEIDDTTCRNFLNDTFDARFGNGWKVDVKTTLRSDAPILVSTWKSRNPPQLYALMIMENYSETEDVSAGRLPCLVFKGIVTSKEMLREENLRQFRQNSDVLHYCLKQDRLHTLDDILNHTEDQHKQDV